MSEIQSNVGPKGSSSEKLSLQDEFASALVSDLPRCPECHKLIKVRDIQKCDYCGFYFGYLAKIFPLEGLPALYQLHDFTETFSESEMDDIINSLNSIKKRYPQLCVKICLLPLQKDVQLHQMALWMLNSCPMPEDQSDKDRDWTILILTDSNTLQSSIASGYSAEVFIPAGNLMKIVTKLNSSLRHGLHYSAYLDALETMMKILDLSKDGVKAKFKQFKKKSRR